MNTRWNTSPPLDADGQPRRAFTADRESTRDLEHLLGLCRGLIADGKLVSQEVVFLDTWLREHEAVCETWPGRILVDRLADIFADDEVSADEAADLYETIESLIGSGLDHGVASGGATAFPVDDDAPIDFEAATICYTGKFIRGSRSECARLSAEVGAVQSSSVTKKTHYLVIGDLASRAWANTSHGRKIDKAMSLKDAGHAIYILSEPQWVAAINSLSGP